MAGLSPGLVGGVCGGGVVRLVDSSDDPSDREGDSGPAAEEYDGEREDPREDGEVVERVESDSLDGACGVRHDR